DPQWSPKAGLVFRPVEGQTFRATYNRAFKSPTTLQTDFYIPDFVAGVGVFGNTSGFDVKKADGTLLAHYNPVVPEKNQTWELGYKGLIHDRLFVDVTGYRSTYENFLSPLTTIAFPAIGSFAYENGQKVVNEKGQNQAVLTYFNLGKAKLRGADLGANYILSPRVDFAGTFSWTDLQSMEGVNIKTVTGAADTAKIRELSTLNSPEKKWSLGANLRDLHDWLGGVTVRHVGGYFFVSGINKGTIPTFTTLDLNVGYKVNRFNTTLNLGVSNLFSCRDADPAAPGSKNECGFGVEHREMVNMPQIGTMLFIGGRYHIQ
ncbi:MAG: TonB-dependent receptor, partial [Gemmatimonadetes bacterium]|nr:TonB-dependent receptor [Gemmatimonadota bacterium]